MESEVIDVLERASNSELASLIVTSYKEVERSFFIESWKTSALDAGHFVEAVRRFIELNLFGKYPPIGKSLSRFDESTLTKYMNAQGEESYRVHIPRILHVTYGIRNKRGVGHVSSVSPNHQDANLLLSNVKWVLSELVRINSDYEPSVTMKLVDRITERHTDGVWKGDGVTRILVPELSLREQVLLLLYTSDQKSETALLANTEYTNKGYFRRLLKGLHSSRLIEYQTNGECLLLPPGIREAETILKEKIHHLSI